MSEDQLKSAAIKLCQLRGIDPYQSVGHGHPEGYAIMLYSPAWMLAKHQIKAQVELMEAIKFGEENV